MRLEAGLVHRHKPVRARGQVDEAAGQGPVTAALDRLRAERHHSDELGAAAARRLVDRGGWDW